MDDTAHLDELDHPHLWLWMRDLSYTCLHCTATRPPGFEPEPGVVCEHPRWLETPNRVLACMECGLLAEG